MGYAYGFHSTLSFFGIIKFEETVTYLEKDKNGSHFTVFQKI